MPYEVYDCRVRATERDTVHVCPFLISKREEGAQAENQ